MSWSKYVYSLTHIEARGDNTNYACIASRKYMSRAKNRGLRGVELITTALHYLGKRKHGSCSIAIQLRYLSIFCYHILCSHDITIIYYESVYHFKVKVWYRTRLWPFKVTWTKEKMSSAFKNYIHFHLKLFFNCDVMTWLIISTDTSKQTCSTTMTKLSCVLKKKMPQILDKL